MKCLTVLKRSVREWRADQVPTHAAALAYYTIFSIGPLLIIAIAVAGVFFGAQAANGAIHTRIQWLVGESGAKVIEAMIVSASKPGAGIVTTLLGGVSLLFGAMGMFGQLQDSLNIIFKAVPGKTTGLISFLSTRSRSFMIVGAVGLLLLASLVLSAVLTAFGNHAGGLLPGWAAALPWVNLLVSCAVITVLIAVIFKILPDVKVAWRDVWFGAVVTALLFSVGKLGIGLYLGRAATASGFGAAAALVVVMIWVYYSALIFFLGAEFTQVYARSYGSLREATPEGVAAAKANAPVAGRHTPDEIPEQRH